MAGSVTPKMADKVTVPNSCFCFKLRARKKYQSIAPPTAMSEIVHDEINAGSYPFAAINEATTGIMKLPAPNIMMNGCNAE